MRVKRRLRIRWLSLFFLLVLPVVAYGGVPEVNHVMVTDVTTTSFSVIWAANEASTAGLEVYADENGSSQIVDAVITAHPIECGDETIKAAAEDNGVMKVMVTGLEPDTTYYFMTITTSKSSLDTTYDPSAAPFTPVITESETVRTYESDGDILPFSNDLIIEPCYLDDGTTFAEGTLLLATLEGGNYPITAFVGDGVDSPFAIIDLNNIFSREAHVNLDLSQGKNLTLVNLRGMNGNSIVTHSVPEDLSLSEVKPPDFGLMAGWNFVSFQIEPVDTALERVLEPILDKVSAIWTYDSANDHWFRYDWRPDAPWWLNDLVNVHALVGYWLLMVEDTSLTVNGSLVTNEPIALYAGWNLVGFRSIEQQNLMDVIDPISDEINAIWSYDLSIDHWFRYDWHPDAPWWLNDLQYIESGKAYWVDVSEDCEW